MTSLARSPLWVALAALPGCACNGREPDLDATEVAFVDRVIDLEPYLTGFPWRPVLPIPDRGIVLFDRDGETRALHQIPLADGAPNLAAARPVSDVDWTTRSRWDMHYHPASGTVLFAGDERNDEVINLFRLDLETGAITRLTDEPYLYGFSLSPDGSEVAFLARRGGGPYETCLQRLALGGGPPPTTVVCDTDAMRFTWSDPVWAPDGSGVVVRMNARGQRTRGNLAWIRFADPRIAVLTDPAGLRTSISALDPWLDPDRFVLRSNEGDAERVGVHTLSTNSTRWFEPFPAQIDAARLHVLDGRPFVLVTLHTAVRDTLVLVDADTGERTASMDVDGTVGHIGHEHGPRHWITVSSASTPFSSYALTLSPGAIERAPWLDLPADVRDALVHCDVQAVQLPTFDVDAATGSARLLHAFLYTPAHDGPEPADALVRVKAFYGGDNSFDIETQVFCEAGVTTLSPAVRGSWGFGSAFERLNDGDLGGNEFIDLFHAARWLEERGYTRGHIGVYGRSHGGYAAMRGLTFPPGTNGFTDVYPFAFGMADAGFSDILAFSEATNIPDWVVKEAGDPATQADKLRDRSPLSHVDLLTAPLFLSHGENDNRVPVAGSRAMAQACADAGKPCTYVEFPGQGHRVRGLDNERALYQARFAFLEALNPTLPPVRPRRSARPTPRR